MSIDIKATIAEITKLEKMQAQVELRTAQIQEDERKLREKLKVHGITLEQLPQKIIELEGLIESKLTLIRSLDKPIEAKANAEESILSIE